MYIKLILYHWDSVLLYTNFIPISCLSLPLSPVDNQMWQRGRHLGAGRASTAGVHHIWGGAARDQRHPLQEASSRLFPVKCLSRRATTCWHLRYHSPPPSAHPPSCCRTALSAWTQSSPTENLPNSAKSSTQPEEPDFFFFFSFSSSPTQPEPDRAVTVKGVGGEEDAGPMTVVTPPPLYKMAIAPLMAAFHFSLYSSPFHLCTYNTSPPTHCYIILFFFFSFSLVLELILFFLTICRSRTFTIST